MTEQDRRSWDDRYAACGRVCYGAVGLPAVFAPYADVFPTAGCALDLACGQGAAALWLASRGLAVWGMDVSAVAIGHARDLLRRSGITAESRFDIVFDVVDLDSGLPPGPPVDLIFCHRFRDRRLDRPIIDRLASGGLLAISALSEVGATAGRFRAGRGELTTAFADLAPIADGEANGEAWLLAVKLP